MPWFERPFSITRPLARLTEAVLTTLQASPPPSMLLRRTLDLRVKVPVLITVPPGRINTLARPDIRCEAPQTRWALTPARGLLDLVG